jgi:hypothetical protein
MHQPNLEYQFQLDGDEDWMSVPMRKGLFSDNCTSDIYIQQKSPFMFLMETMALKIEMKTTLH